MFKTIEGLEVKTVEDLAKLKKGELQKIALERGVPEIFGEKKSDLAQRLYDVALANAGVQPKPKQDEQEAVVEAAAGEALESVEVVGGEVPESVEPEGIYAIAEVKDAVASGVGVEVVGGDVFFAKSGQRVCVNINSSKKDIIRALRYVCKVK